MNFVDKTLILWNPHLRLGSDWQVNKPIVIQNFSATEYVTESGRSAEETRGSRTGRIVLCEAQRELSLIQYHSDFS